VFGQLRHNFDLDLLSRQFLWFRNSKVHRTEATVVIPLGRKTAFISSFTSDVTGKVSDASFTDSKAALREAVCGSGDRLSLVEMDADIRARFREETPGLCVSSGH
jgi:hypothetical protein